MPVGQVTRRTVLADDDTDAGFADRLATAMRRAGMTQATLGAAVGKSESAVSRWIGEGRVPGIATLRRIAVATRTSTDFLLGMTEVPAPASEALHLEKEGEQLVLLSRAAGRVGAGPARLDVPTKPLRYAFRADWFKRRGLDPARLITVLVAKHGGDSMEPMIRPDSLLIVDRGPGAEGFAQLEPHEGKVFLVRAPGEDGMKVKRVYRSGDQLIFFSDNPATKPRVEAIDLKGRRLQQILLGLVVWTGRDED